MRIVVLGAGVVGTAAAYYLARDGHEVIVLDRRGDAASETSWGNAGLVSPGDSTTWASPDALRTFLRSLVRRDLGLRITLTRDPHYYVWMLRFLGQCTTARARANTAVKLRLAFYSRECINALQADTGLAYDDLRRGIMYFYRSQKTLDAGARHMRSLAEAGLEIEIVDRHRLATLEPGLAAVAGQIAGGVYSPMDQTGDSCLFARRLSAYARARFGTEFRWLTTVQGLDVEAGKVRAVRTDRGAVAADAVVIALGAESALLGRRLGLDLPIYPVKGYSATFPISGAGGPTMGGVDEDRLIAYSRLGNRLRIAAAAEFVGYDRSYTRKDFTRIFATAASLFPGAVDVASAELWAGLRPMMPGSVPVLGRARYENLYLDTGHGHVGWTMACGSGRLLADLIAGRRPEIDSHGLLYRN